MAYVTGTNCVNYCNHEFGAWSASDTHTLHKHTCTICKEIEFAEHNYGEWIEIVEPTCTEEGYLAHYHCECGMNFDKNKEIIEDLTILGGHHKIQGNKEMVDSYTIQNDNTYAFMLSNGWYKSSNKTNSTTSTFTINAIYDCTLVLKYKVSSEIIHDKLIILYNSTAKDAISGDVSEKSLTLTLVAGDTVYIKYAKDGSVSSGSDTGWFKIESCTQTEVDNRQFISTDNFEPTCEVAVVCDACQGVIKEALGHTYGEWVSNGDNTHTKTCDRDSTHKVTENCVGGTATCTAKAVCGDCESEYGNMLEHTYDMSVATSNYLKDAATCTSKAVYYKSCVCGLVSKSETFEYGEVLEHTYDMSVATSNYLKDAATCTSKAVYYKSCVCGLASKSETFEYGEVFGHTYQENWCSDEDSHWHECECGEKSDVAAHSWDNGIVSKEPTTKEDGERVFTCNDCGIQKIESIAKKEVPIGAIVGATVGGAGVVGLGGFSFVWFVVKKKSLAELLAIFKRK